MKFLRLIPSLALMTLFAALVFGVATASGTVMCKSSGSPCGEKYGVGTEIKASSEGAVAWHPPIGEINCKKSTSNSVVTNAGGSGTSVTESISTLTFSECNATVTVLKKGDYIAHHIFGTNKVTTTWVNGEVTVGFAGFHCIFGGSVDLGTWTVKVAWPDSFHWNPNLSRIGGSSGAFCGSTAAGTGTYGVSSPAPIYWHAS
jgi:hypothetical protein